jgi:ATP-dependent exoDNAse (exonuclease V) beta subunit
VDVHEAATAHDRHPALHQDLQRAIRLAFNLAQRALETYQEQKRRWGVVDFVDQEVFALELLQRDDIRERLAGEIDLVLVDEFQDTSPLQLAIFIELAKIAPLSVWVGDQKQAIFGFRGTDPALMNAAIEDLLAGTDPQLVDRTVEHIIEASEPETLSLSWRSRPELVRLTSGIFAGAFAAHGIPEGRVRLEPGLATEPEGLGPLVEHWPLRLPDRRKTTELCAATASGVRDLLHDEAAAVRDLLSGDARRARPGDIAVLCRTNAQCGRVANALEALGVRAEVPRVGLFTTPEGRVALAGLALWLDPRSRLAAAELARITEHPDREDEWLGAVLDNEEGDSFGELPSVRGVRQARDEAIDAGPVEAFDRVVAATGLRRLARRWGEDAARVANLDALRAHVVRYVQIANSQRLPETVSGLVRYLRQLGDSGFVNKRTVEPRDQRAVRSGCDAVVVSTWHRAKGLEWPITVLFGLESMRLRDALGVQVAANWDEFDIDRPLDGRWVRYWLTPYRGAQGGTPFRDRLGAHPENLRAVEQDKREQLRLLYVGWTRARDRLALAAMEGRLLSGLLGQLRVIEPSLICTPPADGAPVSWGGQSVTVPVRSASPRHAEPRSLAPGRMATPAGPARHAPAVVVPSALTASGEIGEAEQIGDRLRISGDVNMSWVGNAVHGFLAADGPELTPEVRREMANGLLSRWDVAGALDPDDLIRASGAFRAWCDQHWPGARRSNELPIYHRLENGSVVHGLIDVVLETDHESIIIDHKTFPGEIADALALASGFAGQLSAYGAAIDAAGERPVGATYVHLPVLGRVIPVTAFDPIWSEVNDG